MSTRKSKPGGLRAVSALRFPGQRPSKKRAPARKTPPRPRRLLRAAGLALLGVFVLLPGFLILAYRLVPPPITPLMVIRLVEGEGLHKDWVPIEAISPNFANAVIAGEDNLFCSHFGFDWRALGAEIQALAAGEHARGASTITMQTAKNLFLWPGRDFFRKALEAPYTLALELLWPKRRILEVYLNIVELGPGIYGAEAAARAHFGKSAADLSPREGALLAAVLPNPRAWSASKPGDYVLGRANDLRRRIGQLGPMLDCAH